MSQEHIFDYNSDTYKDFLKEFRNKNENEGMLIVYAGDFDTGRNAAIDDLKREIIGEAVEIDLTDVITPYEEQSYQNIEATLADIDKNTPLVIFKNAEQLTGTYTGFTSSIVRYATPQEKFFLRKVKELSVPVLLEFKDVKELDQTASRVADHVVIFKTPESFLEKMAWKLKNVHVHGSYFFSTRPR